jgi:hypothetical protein
VVSFVSGPEWPTSSPTKESINALIRLIIARSEAVRRLCLIGARWGSEEASRAIALAFAALTFGGKPAGGYTYWVALRDLPASLCFHWALAGALSRDDPTRAAQYLGQPLPRSDDRQARAVSVLPLNTFDTVDWKHLIGFEQRHTPHSDFLYSIFEAEARDVTIGGEEAEQLWDFTEMTIALEFAHHRLERAKETGVWFWTPLGRFAWKRDGGRMDAFVNEVENLPANDPRLAVWLFGGGTASAKAAATAVREFAAKHAGLWRW